MSSLRGTRNPKLSPRKRSASGFPHGCSHVPSAGDDGHREGHLRHDGEIHVPCAQRRHATAARGHLLPGTCAGPARGDRGVAGAQPSPAPWEQTGAAGALRSRVRWAREAGRHTLQKPQGRTRGIVRTLSSMKSLGGSEFTQGTPVSTSVRVGSSCVWGARGVRLGTMVGWIEVFTLRSLALLS